MQNTQTPNPTKASKSSFYAVMGILIFSIIYAVVRYTLFIPENLPNIPAFVLNKAVSMASVIALAFAGYHGFRRQKEQAKYFYCFAGLAILLHIILSIFVLRPDYLPRFFTEDGLRMSLRGELLILFGALAALCSWVLWQSRNWPGLNVWLLGQVFLIFSLVHVGAVFLGRAITFPAHHAYLPSISLISFIALLIALAFGVLLWPGKEPKRSRKQSQSTTKHTD